MIASHKQEIPFTLLLLPFLAGLCLAILFPCTGYITTIQIAFGFILAAFITLNLLYKHLNIYKIKWAGGLMIYLLLILAGAICLEANRENNSPDHFSKTKSAYLIGKISNEPKKSNGILRFTIRVEQVYSQNKLKPVKGNLLVFVKTDSTQKNELLYGNELLLPANFTAVEPPLNPAEFNYKGYLAHQNIYQQTFLNQKQLVVIGKSQGNPMVSFALSLRTRLVNKLKLNMRDTDAVAVASTIILGYRADLRKEVQQAYTQTGTMHLLSVAGMHVAFIYLLISLILGFLTRYPKGKLIKAIISIILIWCYALITGFSPAVCRAVLMLSMVIIGFTFNRHINKLNVLAVSAFILLLYNPFYIMDAGFQLSYLAVFGILIIQPYIYKWFDIQNKIAKEIWLACSVSIAAQIILFPLSALYFHDFPVYFLISNVFVIIPAAITMYLGIAYLALPSIPVVSASLAWCLEKTVTIMTKTLTLIEHAPYGNISKIWLTPIAFVLAYAIIISVYYSFTKANKVALKISLACLLLVCTSMSVNRYHANKTNSLTFFSLRKNLGILFKHGDTATLLTNLKETDKAYQYSIQPYLDSCKINTTHLIDIKADSKESYLIKKENLIQFDNKRLLILDKWIENNATSNKLDIDYIYITGNPHISLQLLKQNFNFKMLIADGTNSNNLLNKLQHDALLAKVDFKNINRNKALILTSNN